MPRAKAKPQAATQLKDKQGSKNNDQDNAEQGQADLLGMPSVQRRPSWLLRMCVCRLSRSEAEWEAVLGKAHAKAAKGIPAFHAWDNLCKGFKAASRSCEAGI